MKKSLRTGLLALTPLAGLLVASVSWGTTVTMWANLDQGNTATGTTFLSCGGHNWITAKANAYDDAGLSQCSQASSNSNGNSGSVACNGNLAKHHEASLWDGTTNLCWAPFYSAGWVTNGNTNPVTNYTYCNASPNVQVNGTGSCSSILDIHAESFGTN